MKLAENNMSLNSFRCTDLCLSGSFVHDSQNFVEPLNGCLESDLVGVGRNRHFDDVLDQEHVLKMGWGVREVR